MSTTAHQTTDQQLKAKHRALWASGDYPAVAADQLMLTDTPPRSITLESMPRPSTRL